MVRRSCTGRPGHELDVEACRHGDARLQTRDQRRRPVAGEKDPTILNSPCQVPVTLVEPGLFLMMKTRLGL